MVVRPVPTTPPNVHLVHVKYHHPLLAGTVTVPTAIPVNTKMNLVKHPVICVRQDITKVIIILFCVLNADPVNTEVVVGVDPVTTTPLFVHPASMN